MTDKTPEERAREQYGVLCHICWDAGLTSCEHVATEFARGQANPSQEVLAKAWARFVERWPDNDEKAIYARGQDDPSPAAVARVLREAEKVIRNFRRKDEYETWHQYRDYLIDAIEAMIPESER